ncbi:MAG: Asp-tRNA(Asn)/Glu-tRNA(Gln) amidotransferase subunit GatC [bacterium]
MGIDRREVEHIANLARLDLSEEEKELFTEQLGAIVEYVEKLKELNVDEVEPTCHIEKMTNRLREDEPKASLSPEEALSNAPEAESGQFRVPLVVKELSV